jgi:hypothetical protein
MSPNLSRRRLLAAAGTATLGGLAGCTSDEINRLNPLWDAPITMKLIAASGDETDVTCTIESDAVSDLPELKEPLDSLADAEDGQRVVKGLTTATGQQISNMLTKQCGEDVGGLYNYEGSWYLLGLTFKAQEDHQDHHEQQGGHTGTETDTPTETN